MAGPGVERMLELDAREVAGWTRRLGEPAAGAGDAEPVEQLRALEELKRAAEAAQARAAVALDEMRRAQHEAAGVPSRRRGEGVASEVGLSRRESPKKAARQLALAKVLVGEMPHTLVLMRGGRLSEWRATILARETACLSLEDRQAVDRELCATGRAAAMSDREIEHAARRLAAKLDNAAVAARARKAESERAVTIRPAPDSMAWVTALLPVKQAVAVWATLTAAADTARATGEPRSRGQVMADTLLERVTGHAPTDPVPVHLDLVITDRTLFGHSDQPADVPGFGPVPADWAREAAGTAAQAGAAFIRRLYTHPEIGQLVAMESRSRTAPAGLSHFIAVRDGGICRTPYCGAPIRHTDHIEEHADGGPTSERNLQGLCERCNLAKQAPGWSAKPGSDPGAHNRDHHPERSPIPIASPRPTRRLSTGGGPGRGIMRPSDLTRLTIRG